MVVHCEPNLELGNKRGHHLNTPPLLSRGAVTRKPFRGASSEGQVEVSRNTALLPVDPSSFQNLAPGGGGSSCSATIEKNTAFSVLQIGLSIQWNRINDTFYVGATSACCDKKTFGLQSHLQTLSSFGREVLSLLVRHLTIGAIDNSLCCMH